MESLWIETTKDKIKLESLKRDETTEVCIIGGGLFGLTTAYYLSQNGFKVTVLEKDEIGKRASGNTTGKITSQHDLFYAHLIDDYGEEFAKKYREELTLHLDKIKKIKKVLNSHNITLLYAAKDTKNNQAIILKDFIENIKSGA